MCVCMCVFVEMRVPTCLQAFVSHIEKRLQMFFKSLAQIISVESWNCSYLLEMNQLQLKVRDKDYLSFYS